MNIDAREIDIVPRQSVDEGELCDIYATDDTEEADIAGESARLVALASEKTTI